MKKDRFNTAWYQKRIDDSIVIKSFLIDKIEEHEKALPWSRHELTHIKYEDLFEIAIAAVNKKISITLGEGSDFSNNKDAKVSIVRTCSYGREYAGLVNCSNKESILSLVYEAKKNKFYFFNLPLSKLNRTYKQIGIPFDLETGEPKKGHWAWNFECKTFEKMAKSR